MTGPTAPSQPDVVVRSAVPTFLVADVAGTARWYAANLGFRTAGAVPDHEPYVFASLMRGTAEIMLLDLAGYEKPDLRDRRPAGLWDDRGGEAVRADAAYPPALRRLGVRGVRSERLRRRVRVILRPLPVHAHGTPNLP